MEKSTIDVIKNIISFHIPEERFSNFKVLREQALSLYIRPEHYHSEKQLKVAHSNVKFFC